MFHITAKSPKMRRVLLVILWHLPNSINELSTKVRYQQ